jgi:type IV secretion system protein VirB3
MEGYEIPVHRALTEQILMGGVPRSVGLLNGTIAAAFGIGLHSFYVIPICTHCGAYHDKARSTVL